LQQAVPGVTVSAAVDKGAFDVSDVATGKVYHSKSEGAGHLNVGHAKMDAVVAALKQDVKVAR
jgi:hypothetical protein